MGASPHPFRRSTGPEGFIWSVLFALGVLVLVSHLLPLVAFKSQIWGSHAFAFFPPGFAWGATAALLGVGFVLLRRTPLPAFSLPRTDRWPSPLRADRWMIPAAILGFALCWIFRARHTLLGDGIPLTIELARGGAFHPREPLSFMLQRTFHDLIAPLASTIWPDPLARAEAAVSLWSAVAGGLLVPVVINLVREAARTVRKETPGRVILLASGILLAQGTMQLFFGYVENYTTYALAVAVCLWLSLRYLNGRAPLLLPLLAFILAFFLHLSGAVFLPAVFVLALFGWRTGRSATLRDLAVAAAVFLALAAWMRLQNAGYNVVASALQVGGWALTRQEERDPGYLTAPQHLRDFLNEQMLIGPLGLFLLIPLAAAALARRRLGYPGIFLVVAAAAYAAVSWLAGDSNLGYARNWDLLAPAGIVYTTAAILLAFRANPSSRWFALALALSLYHTVPWVLMNTSTERSLARVESLPLGGGRSEALIATWYWNRGDTDAAKAWSLKALEVNPQSHVALRNLAMIDMAAGNFVAAAASYALAAALRADQPEYRRGFVRARLAEKEIDGVGEALAGLPPLAADAELWLAFSRLLLEQGHLEASREAVHRAQALDPAVRTTPLTRATDLAEGDTLALHGDRQGAENAYRRALAADSTSYAAHVKLGILLAGMGRDAEAVVSFERATRLGEDATAWFNLGLAQARLDKREAARRALQEARSRTSDPNLKRTIDELLDAVGAP